MSTLEVVTAVVGIISILLLALQVQLAAKTLRDDHLRRKKQATLEYLIVHLRSHWSADLREFSKRFGDADLRADQLAQFAADQEANAAIVPLLGSIEHLAVGVNMGVYDRDLLNRASGAYLIRTFCRFQAYIEAEQAKQPTVYVEFKTLVKDLETIRAARRR